MSVRKDSFVELMKKERKHEAEAKRKADVQRDALIERQGAEIEALEQQEGGNMDFRVAGHYEFNGKRYPHIKFSKPWVLTKDIGPSEPVRHQDLYIHPGEDHRAHVDDYLAHLKKPKVSVPAKLNGHGTASTTGTSPPVSISSGIWKSPGHRDEVTGELIRRTGAFAREEGSRTTASCRSMSSLRCASARRTKTFRARRAMPPKSKSMPRRPRADGTCSRSSPARSATQTTSRAPAQSPWISMEARSPRR